MQLVGVLKRKIHWRTFLDSLYLKFDNILHKETCEILAGALLLCEKETPKDDQSFHDRQSMGAYSRRDYSPMVSLLHHLHPSMEAWTGKKLYPTFSYCRVYRNGHSLWKHIDRPECEYSITITLKDDGTPWPIIMGDEEILLPQGSGCVYMGEKIPHERKPYEGNEHVQVFCHYIDVDGPHAERVISK